MALLDEAVDRALEVVRETRPELDERTHREIAEAVGIGAVKYADLSTAHDTEYVFDFDRMLALTGNTGPYLQYAAARCRSIFRKAGTTADDVAGRIVVGEPAERALALALLGFGAVVGQVDDTLEPHRLCNYLFSVGAAFTTFYEQCPVLREGHERTRDSRLALCAQTLRTLETGLGLLGVRVPEQM
jgi:arginyl-tRNA synthetase